MVVSFIGWPYIAIVSGREALWTTLSPDAPLHELPEPCQCKTFPEAMVNMPASKSRRGSQATFVQIGANDGQNADPLYPFLVLNKSAWVAVMVEPTPDLYDKLRALHSDTNWGFYNGALATEDKCINGNVTFWELPGKRYNETGWWTMVNTIDPKSPHSKTFLAPVNRSCLTDFFSLLQLHGSPAFRRRAWHDGAYHVDLLQIDVECADYTILKMINFATFKPRHIQYETLNCDKTGENEKNAEALLRSHGYEVYHASDQDAFAVLV